MAFTNKIVQLIWLFTAGQKMIHYVPCVTSFGTLALCDCRSIHPLIFLLLFLPSLLLLRGPGVCGTITVGYKGKWDPCVWWKGAVTVTQYSHRGIPHAIHPLTHGVKCYRSLNGPLSFCLLCSLVLLKVGSVGTQHIPEDSGDKRSECGMGPTSTRVAPLFWCFGSVLHSDTMPRRAGVSFYCFQSVSTIS